MNDIINPFQISESSSAIVEIEQSRSTQEVQAAMVIAKKFPRDENAAMNRILKSCTRPTLAEQALYAYPKGGTVVTGPSIRLAEAVAQNWGNIQFGIKELDREDGKSTMESYAWDLETNTRQSKVFHVEHVRRAGGKNNKLNDPRDIYEMTANLGARRLRACILGVIPGDVIDAAVRQCEVTQAGQDGAPADQIEKMIEAFKAYNVTKEMIAKYLGHNTESVIGAEIVNLKRIYSSLKDGMAKPDDFFKDPTGKPEVSMPQAKKNA